MRPSRRALALLQLSESCAASFIERGDASVTVAELAACAGVSERTFYRAFATKEESIRPLLDNGNRTLLAALEQQPDDATLGDAVIGAFMASVGEIFEIRTRALMPVIMNDPALLRVWQGASFETAELIRHEVARRIGVTAQSVPALVAAGQAVVAVIAALGEMSRHHTPAAKAIEIALHASSQNFFDAAAASAGLDFTAPEATRLSASPHHK